MKVSDLKNNPTNPRVIKDDKFKKLVKSLQEFPEMMEKRPLVCVTDVDGKIYPLGGNMRLKGIKELQMKEIPDKWVHMADDWTEEQRKEFIIKDNVGFGEWDFEELQDWDVEQLEDWGLDVGIYLTDEVDNFGDIIELPNITTTYNINIKCSTPDELDSLKDTLKITTNYISYSDLINRLK